METLIVLLLSRYLHRVAAEKGVGQENRPAHAHAAALVSGCIGNELTVVVVDGAYGAQPSADSAGGGVFCDERVVDRRGAGGKNCATAIERLPDGNGPQEGGMDGATIWALA